ncbi:MAG: protein arginine kinase, partial [Candidatus Eisenbacteria bacterium]|nr:protein arginine kinase [Candidatus Eisenbacteria bacterium]
AMNDAAGFDHRAAGPSPWLDGSGPFGDRVVSTRVRLARNLANVPFTHRARDEQLQGVLGSVVRAAEQAGALAGGRLLRMDTLSEIERQVLVERHLVSHEMGRDARPRGLLIGREERLSIMINEEDHVRLQSLASGFQLHDAYAAVERADDDLDDSLEFAFSEEIGYLTACPTNTGTGMRASVLIHLPALVLLKEIQKVITGITQVGLNVRGLYGEHSAPMGNLFQISNQTTLGRTEQDSIESLERVSRQVLEAEERARERLVRDARVQIEDKVWRAYGLLRHCRSASSEEVINLCSAVRLGVSLGIEGLPPIAVLNEMLVHTQPAHLQQRAGGELGADERNVVRARYVRERLAASERATGGEG